MLHKRFIQVSCCEHTESFDRLATYKRVHSTVHTSESIGYLFGLLAIILKIVYLNHILRNIFYICIELVIEAYTTFKNTN